MKKLCVALTLIILAMSVCACGRETQQPAATIPSATTPATTPSEDMTLPTIDPTMGTNIPDPEVDPNSTMDMTDPSANDNSNTPTENNENARGDLRKGSRSQQDMNFEE